MKGVKDWRCYSAVMSKLPDLSFVKRLDSSVDVELDRLRQHPTLLLLRRRLVSDVVSPGACGGAGRNVVAPDAPYMPLLRRPPPLQH